MKRILHLLTASLVLLNPTLPFADEEAVTFLNQDDIREQSTSPFFAGFQGVEVPAGEFVEGASPQQSLSGFNFGYHAPTNDRLQALNSTVNVTEFQTLVNAGLTGILFENSHTVISGRAMGGFAFGHDELDDSWNTSFDLFGAGKLGPSGKNLIKLGAFVDNQDDFGKWGPALGILLGADSAHPVTIDAAYGMGFGDPYTVGQSVYSVADDDLQIQAGIALNPNLEVGVTGQYVKWGGVFSEEQDWKTGGFLRYHAPKGYSVSLGAAGGEHGATGFLHFTVRPRIGSGTVFAPGSKSSAKSTIPSQDFSFARSWMVSPIQRQESLQIRRENVPQATEAPRGTLACTVTDSLNSIGPLLAGVLAIHRVTYTNTGTLDQVVTINSIQNFDGTFASPGTTATLAPGQSLTAQGPETAAAIPANLDVVITVNGQQFTRTCSFPTGSPFPTTLPLIVIAP